MAHRLRCRPAPDVTEPPANTIEEIPPNEAADRNEDDIPAQTVERRRMTVDISASAGVFMAVFDLIPLVGATIGSVVVIASAFIFVDTRAGIIMFVIVMVYQQIENHILQPLIYGRTVQIPSLTVLIAVLCGGAVLGLIGALLAIPIAGTIHAVVSELLDERAERINGTPKLGV